MRERGTDRYAEFLSRKAQAHSAAGFEPIDLPSAMMPFQVTLTAWALRQGRGAIFADCGLGKSLMQLAWADNVCRKTNRPVLILAPLAVAQQTVDEASKFGLDCFRTAGEVRSGAHVHITNYEKLHHFKPEDWSGVACDESSAIKSFNGKRRAKVTEFMRRMSYRSLWTATAAPNDYIELGTSSEALGEMGHMDMLGRFFKNDVNTSDTKGRMHGKKIGWRFKGHAESAFWRWVCSWARACRMPSDLGFPDDGFVLPKLEEREHVVVARTLPPGMLFAVPAVGFREEREERRRTVKERCERVADLVNHDDPAVVWCHLNAEGDLLESLIPDARQVKGANSDEEKEAAYRGFADGSIRVLITKPKIGAWGLNWQHCAHVVTFASHSYEQYYQSVRRCWRFGQFRPVRVDVVASEGEQGIKNNLHRKALASTRMFAALVDHMNDAQTIKAQDDYSTEAEVPAWA